VRINIWCPLFKFSYALTQRWLQKIDNKANQIVSKKQKIGRCSKRAEGILPATAVLCTFYQRFRGMACQGMMKETSLGCHLPTPRIAN
jgi:O-acetyl-ADP-ribose deacetylase (regulator of RNase III)